MRYDPAERKASVRKGRERGCWVFIPAAELVKTGTDLAADPPYYRVWGSPRGKIVVQLYRERMASEGNPTSS